MPINIDHTGASKTLSTDANGLLVEGVAVQSALVSGTNIKTINSTSLLGSTDITLFSGGLIKIEKVTSLPGSPDANTLYIVTG